jgi:hypothetical protein
VRRGRRCVAHGRRVRIGRGGRPGAWLLANNTRIYKCQTIDRIDVAPFVLLHLHITFFDALQRRRTIYHHQQQRQR